MITVKDIPIVLHASLKYLEVCFPRMDAVTRINFFTALLQHSALDTLHWEEDKNYNSTFHLVLYQSPQKPLTNNLRVLQMLNLPLNEREIALIAGALKTNKVLLFLLLLDLPIQPLQCMKIILALETSIVTCFGLCGEAATTATYFSATKSLETPVVAAQTNGAPQVSGFLAFLNDRPGQVARACSLPVLRFLAKSRIRGVPVRNPGFTSLYSDGEIVFTNEEKDFLRNGCGIKFE